MHDDGSRFAPALLGLEFWSICGFDGFFTGVVCLSERNGQKHGKCVGVCGNDIQCIILVACAYRDVEPQSVIDIVSSGIMGEL